MTVKRASVPESKGEGQGSTQNSESTVCSTLLPQAQKAKVGDQLNQNTGNTLHCTCTVLELNQRHGDTHI